MNNLHAPAWKMFNMDRCCVLSKSDMRFHRWQLTICYGSLVSWGFPLRLKCVGQFRTLYLKHKLTSLQRLCPSVRSHLSSESNTAHWLNTAWNAWATTTFGAHRSWGNQLSVALTLHIGVVCVSICIYIKLTRCSLMLAGLSCKPVNNCL